MGAYLGAKANRITIDDLAPPGARAAAQLIRREGIRRILKSGEPADALASQFLLLVERGRLDLFLPTVGSVANSHGVDDGAFVGSVAPGSVFGEMPLLAMRTFGARAKAAEETEVLLLGPELIVKLL